MDRLPIVLRTKLVRFLLALMLGGTLSVTFTWVVSVLHRNLEGPFLLGVFVLAIWFYFAGVFAAILLVTAPRVFLGLFHLQKSPLLKVVKHFRQKQFSTLAHGVPHDD